MLRIPIAPQLPPPLKTRYWRTRATEVDAVVVGGGISGLCTAKVLTAKHGQSVESVMVTEARNRVGGNIITERRDGYLWEEGPNSFQPSDGALEMAVLAGMEKELVLGDPKAPRFVYWDRKLRKTPSGPDALTFDLLSPWGKIRAGLGAIGIKDPLPENEETIEAFIRRNLGKEVFERLIEPFCSGVYAGDPAQLSMKAAFGKIYALEKAGGSLIGGSLKLMSDRRKNPPPPRDPSLPPKPAGMTVASFKGGLRTLPDALANQLGDRIKTEWRLMQVEKSSDDRFVLTYDTPSGVEEVLTKSVALTVPSYVAADLLQGICKPASDVLGNIDYPPVGAVTLSYPYSAIREDRLDETGLLPGFGQLHPRSQGVVTLGTIYSSSLFPGRAPDGRVLLLNYIGGATNRGIVSQSDQQLVDQVDRDLRTMLLKPDAPSPTTVGVRVWPRAIPQFNLGHLDALDEARKALDSMGWQNLKLGGNYVCGVALGKCMEYAYGFAEEIANELRSSDGVTPSSTPSTTPATV